MKRLDTDSFDPFETHETREVPPEKIRRGPGWTTIAVLLAVGAAFGAWRLMGGEAPEVASAPAPAAPVVAAVEAVPALPPLGERDAAVRRAIAALSGSPDLMRWLLADDLAGRFVSAVHAIAEGTSPAAQFRGILPSAHFQVRGKRRRPVADVRSFKPYDIVADVFTSFEPRAAAAAYRALEPMFEAAHREVGRPGTPFRDTLNRAIEHLMATPMPERDMLLTEVGIFYGYADPEFEGLSRAQKQLLRLGAGNARRVQEHLGRIADAINGAGPSAAVTP